MTYHYTLKIDGVPVDCTEIDEKNEALASELFAEFGHDMANSGIEVSNDS